GLQHERKAAVLVHADLCRHDVAALALRGVVVRLDELHDVHAVLTQCGADGGRRSGLAGGQLQGERLDELLLLGRHGSSWSGCGFVRAHATDTARPGGRFRLAHACDRPEIDGQIFETWLKLSSTGVSRPKIETSALSFCWSALISLIVAGREANGPSMTVTESPTSKSSTRTSGFAPFLSGWTAGASHLSTSSRESGAGRSARSVDPTKPVTPGVLRTQEYDSGVRSIRT